MTDAKEGTPRPAPEVEEDSELDFSPLPWRANVDERGAIDRSQVPGPRYGVFREFLVWILVVGAAAVLARQLAIWGEYGIFHIGVMIMTIAVVVMISMAAISRPWVTEPDQDEWLARQRVAVVITFFNEDRELLLRCLRSVVTQTRQPDVVWVIDDGSNDRATHTAANEWAASQSVNVITHRVVQNRGKRHAQAYAFSRDDAEIFVAVDSDSVLDPYAIEEVVKPLADPTNQVVSGSIVGLNWRRNLLTRVLDIEFVNSFVVGRASLNPIRAMNVTCGVLAAYRGSAVRKYLDAYVNQRFLGSTVRAGDDRDLTQFALLEGRGVHQESAVAYTALPERIGHLFRQRFRWGSSLYRGTVWVNTHLSFTHPAYWVLMLQLAATLCGFVAWAWLIVWEPIVGQHFHFGYVGYLFLLSALGSCRYLVAFRRNQTTRQKWLNYLLSPLVAVLYIFLLTPTLLVSVFGVRERKWWTRDVVEVSLDLRDLPDSDIGDAVLGARSG